MSSTFIVRSSVNTQLGGDYLTLEGARSIITLGCQPTYIEEYSDGNLNSRPICHSFYPPPQPAPPRAGIVDDITQSIAYANARVALEKVIYELDVVEIADQAESQPQEDILSDICRDRASGVYLNKRYVWNAVLPTAAASEAERCIVDELTGLATVILARRFREVSKSLLRVAEELERN